ncbi:MAG: nucleotidyltransferase family protein [Desulfobacterales bacterium]|jgi:hypothetical protein
MASIEYQILLAGGHVDPDEEQQARLAELMAADFDQDHLVRLARKEGMSGLLYKSLKKAGILGFLGHRQMQQLQSFYYRTVQHNLQVVQDLKQILQNSNEKGIQVVLLQGVALLGKGYKDIGLRPLTDIDLWVLPEKRDVFDSLLQQLGYQPDPVYPSTFKKDPIIIDINSHILWADRIKSRERLLAKNQHVIHDSIEVFSFEGVPAGCLNAADQVLYLSLHAFKHNASRLVWLVDIKHLITRWKTADWKALFERAAEMGQVNIVYDMLYLIAHLFDLKPPPEIETMAAEHGLTWLERVILDKRADGRPLPNWAPLLLFTAGKNLKTRAHFVFETLFPRPEILRQVFANSANLNVWHLYLKRVRQLVSQVRL